MKSLLAGAALVAAVASSAAAQITPSSLPGAPDPGLGTLSPQVNVLNFNGGAASVPAGITITGGAFKTGFSSGQWAQPPGSLSGPEYYTTVGNYNTPETVVIDFTTWLAGKSVLSLSLYWGSIDTYNTLEVLGTGNSVLGTFGGGVFPPANGDQGDSKTNRRVNFAFGAFEQTNFRGLRFTSSQAAFEFDDIALATVSPGISTVPEPATVSMLAFALTALGVAGARRKRSASSTV